MTVIVPAAQLDRPVHALGMPRAADEAALVEHLARLFCWCDVHGLLLHDALEQAEQSFLSIADCAEAP